VEWGLEGYSIVKSSKSKAGEEGRENRKRYFFQQREGSKEQRDMQGRKREGVES